jgi:cytochrome c-type biogenesis protein CcmH
VREQIAAGKTDREIIDYMVTRYGDFVLYQPPVKASTLLLWGGPALLLLAGALAMAGVVRSRRRAPEERPLTAEERERAARLLGEANAKKTP